VSFFDAAFNIVVNAEGGYVNDPKDPGGETKYGISKRSYPQLDIANITLEQAKAIYLRDYWHELACELMPWEFALITFDCAVNQGVGVAKSISHATQNAEDFQAARALRYAALPTFVTYGKGWMRRLFHILKIAQVTPP